MEPASRQRVGLVPARYLDNPDIGALELAVLFILCAHANRLGVCWPSQATIAAKAKLDRGTVNRILAKLAALGLVEKGRHPNPRIRACTYRLVGHDALMGDFLDGLDTTAEEAPAATPVVVHDTEHSEQDSLSLRRAGAPRGATICEKQEDGSDAAPVLDETWVPDHADRTFAQVHRGDLEQSDFMLIVQKFTLHYRGRRIADPSSLFRRWLLTERKNHARTNEPNGRRPASHHSDTRRAGRRGDAAPSCSGQARFDAWARAALARQEHFAHVG